MKYVTLLLAFLINVNVWAAEENPAEAAMTAAETEPGQEMLEILPASSEFYPYPPRCFGSFGCHIPRCFGGYGCHYPRCYGGFGCHYPRCGPRGCFYPRCYGRGCFYDMM